MIASPPPHRPAESRRSRPQVYFDYAATTPLAPEAREAMRPFESERFGNPSNLHSFGRDARRALDRARDSLAERLGCAAKELYFTSGGTEADNLALFGIARALRDRGDRILVSTIEHHAVLESAERLEREGFRVVRVPVDSSGRVDPDHVRARLDADTILVSVMAANNEVGTLQPIETIAHDCRLAGVAFHTDAVQAAGALRIDLSALDVDALSISAHKFHGPKGIGALFVRSGIRFEPLLFGGSQERERRAGTENVPAIVGMATALEVALTERDATWRRIESLRSVLERGLTDQIPGAEVNGARAERLPGLLNVEFPGADTESVILGLDLEGIAVSSGAACSSGAFEPSHVLLAMGRSPERAGCSIRFSLGSLSTADEVEFALDVVPRVVDRARGVDRTPARPSGGMPAADRPSHRP